MAKSSGLGQRLLVHGVNLSGDVGAIGRVGGGPAVLDVTGIDVSAFERIGGLRDGSIEFTAFFNVAASQAHPTLSTLPTTDRIVTVLTNGTTVATPAASCVAKQINYDGTRAQDGAFTFAVQALSNGYGVEWGDTYTAGIRTDTAATNGTAVDAGASSAFGLQAYLHVLSVTGTSVTVALQESSDNGGADAFAAITGGAFSAVTPAGAPTAQRIATATNLTVERYVRVVTTGTFSNAQFVVQVVRNAAAPTF